MLGQKRTILLIMMSFLILVFVNSTFAWSDIISEHNHNSTTEVDSSVTNANRYDDITLNYSVEIGGYSGYSSGKISCKYRDLLEYPNIWRSFDIYELGGTGYDMYQDNQEFGDFWKTDWVFYVYATNASSGDCAWAWASISY